MVYKILLYNNIILRKKNKKIKKFTNLNNIINKMFNTMYYYNGIGLSAPQVGKNIKLFIIRYNNMVVINPKIIKFSSKEIINKEGCLSIPNKYLYIKRKKKIIVKYYDKKWKKNKIKLKNLLSIIFQHEYDHLKGKLILDYVKKI